MTDTTGERSPTCFIAMPITTSQAHRDLFGDPEHWQHVMETLFIPAIEAAGFEPLRPVAKGSHMIHAEIVRQLEQADMVLCDLSLNNPNVFFELGVRTSVNKPVALVRCDAESPIPFDVSGINTHTYDPGLKAWKNVDEVAVLADHLRDAAVSCAGANPMWKQFGLSITANEPTADVTREDAQLQIMAADLRALRDALEQPRPTLPPNLIWRSSELDVSVFDDLETIKPTAGLVEASATIKNLANQAGFSVALMRVGETLHVHMPQGLATAGDIFKGQVMAAMKAREIPVRFVSPSTDA